MWTAEGGGGRGGVEKGGGGNACLWQRELQRHARGGWRVGKALQEIHLRTLPPPNAPNFAAPPAAAPGAVVFGVLPPNTSPGPFLKLAAVALLAAGLPNPNAGPALGAAAAPDAAPDAAAARCGPPNAAKPGLDGWDGLVAGAASAASAAAVGASCGVLAAAALGPAPPPGEDFGAGKHPKAAAAVGGAGFPNPLAAAAGFVAAAVGCAKKRDFKRLTMGANHWHPWQASGLSRARVGALDQA